MAEKGLAVTAPAPHPPSRPRPCKPHGALRAPYPGKAPRWKPVPPSPAPAPQRTPCPPGAQAWLTKRQALWQRCAQRAAPAGPTAAERALTTPPPSPRPRAPCGRAHHPAVGDLATVARRLRARSTSAARPKTKPDAKRHARAEAERHPSAAAYSVTRCATSNGAWAAAPPAAAAAGAALAGRGAVLLESISDDDFDVSTADTDDQLSFRRPGIGVEVTRRLRSGHWSILAPPGLARPAWDDAREALGEFIRHAHKIGLRAACAWCMAGDCLARQKSCAQGPRSAPLVQKNEVLAFAQARPMDAGARALCAVAAATCFGVNS